MLDALAGGRLGAAVFDPVDVPAGTLAVAVLAAMLLGGGAVALLSSPGLPTEPSTFGAADSIDTDPNSDTDQDAAPPTQGLRPIPSQTLRPPAQGPAADKEFTVPASRPEVVAERVVVPGGTRCGRSDLMWVWVAVVVLS